MTIPNKSYTLTPDEFSVLMYFQTGGVITDYQPKFTVKNISLDAGLDQMARGEITYSLKYWTRNLAPDLVHMHLNWGIRPSTPHSYILPEIAAGADSAGTFALRAWQTGVGTWLNTNQDDLIDNGIYVFMVNFDPGAPDANGEGVYYSITLPELKIYFFNPIVNSIDRLWAPTAGGVAVVLTGLGFNNSDSEIETGGPAQPGGWNDEVDTIEFIGLQGQGTTSLTRGAGDFTLDSNTQITIPANKFPALSSGSYHINLKKISVDLDAGTTITGYAGDWACETDGAVFASDRITFFISDTYVDRPFRTRKAPILLTDWHLKDRSDGSEIMKYYSMDTVRCPDRVYTGVLSAISSIPRGFNDKTGLFNISDLTLDLANNKQEFSILLAGETILKNQTVKLYQAYPDEPFGWRQHILSVIIDDYYFEDEIFKVKLKDITQKYFRLGVPRAICEAAYTVEGTAYTYPNIHPDSIGAFIPEVLGLCTLTSGEFRGQIEALCIDTTTFKYVAANGILHSIDEVYSDAIGVVDSGDYTISRERDGRTYITFDADQENKKITYNGKGYIYGTLNSANGYVQNPAYILLYFLLHIVKVPPTFIAFESFLDAATVFENRGADEAGKLILQDEQNPMDVTQDLMDGAKIYPQKDGRLAFGMKDMSNYTTNKGQAAPVIFRQLDIVGKFERQYNLRDAITEINAEYDYVPTWDLFKSNVSQKGDVTIDPWDPTPVTFKKKSPTVGTGGGGRRRIRDWIRA